MIGSMLLLSKLRTGKQWSKAKLARHADLDQGTLSHIEHRRLVPYPVQLRRLARALDWPEEQAAALLEDVPPDAERAQI
jgi:transcriptional regulator with XRE-family HTH domain